MAAIGFRHACDVLLKHGADINAKTNDGETPLDIAIKQNLPRMIGHLRALGAQTDDAVGDDSQPAEKQAEQTRDGFRIGSVTWYRGDRGYGYLRDGEAKESSVYGELFFDRESVFGREPDSVEEGTPLSFQVIHDKFGLRAANVEFA